jgi:hypothetical protein
VPSLGTREAFAFGEGVALPTRLRFSQLGADLIPKSESVSSAEMMDGSRGIDAAFIERVVERWRGATMGNKRKVGHGGMQDNKPRQSERYRRGAGPAARRGAQPAPRTGLQAAAQVELELKPALSC